MILPLRAALVSTLLLAACATAPLPREDAAPALSARLAAVLERRGLAPDALSTIDKLSRRPTPPHAPAPVREFMANPASMDAAAIFERSVPASLRRFVEEVSAPPVPAGGTEVRALVDAYVAELAEAQRQLRSAYRGAPLEGALADGLHADLLLGEQIMPIAEALDRAGLQAATDQFLGATARFTAALRAGGDRLRWPAQAERFDSAIGAVVIGSTRDDSYGPDAALIVDPGGNDAYRRAPLAGGAVSVIVDLAGEDRYEGSDVAVHGFSAIVDFSGNDRYRMDGPGIAAAIAGASLLLDFSGDDRYEAGRFGQGAGLLGLGALVDLRGDDRYRLDSGGQGFGAIGGTGLLWDRQGNDRYAAAGPPDDFDRGGGLSLAQGVGFGLRTPLGGGTGLLRDDEGDDEYEAQLFAQGTAYWFGLGLLWDRAGGDRYRAARYAQGCGVHFAAGLLRDESGDDRYELTVGVGQGMGLDLAVGVLSDGSGNDGYRAPDIAQGAGTANGVGLLADAGGADRFEMTATVIRAGWGRAQWRRGGPSLGFVLHGEGATFEHAGRPEPLAGRSLSLGGPYGGWPVEFEEE